MQRVSSVETSPLPPTSTLPFVPRSTVSGLGVSLMDPLTLRRIAASNLYFSLNVAHVGPGRGIRTCDLMLGLRVSVAALRSACSCLMLRRLPLHIQLELLEHAATWMINQSRSFSCSVTGQVRAAPAVETESLTNKTKKTTLMMTLKCL